MRRRAFLGLIAAGAGLSRLAAAADSDGATGTDMQTLVERMTLEEKIAQMHAFWLLLSEDADALWTNYVEAQMQSQGAKIRVLMNAIPAALMLVWGKRLAPDPQERKLWTWIALVALLCLPIVSLATTAVDRVALYLIPIQIFVFSRIPRLAGGNIRVRTLLVLGVIGYYAAVQFVWLNFATHSQYWVPYQFKPFV